MKHKSKYLNQSINFTKKKLSRPMDRIVFIKSKQIFIKLAYSLKNTYV